MVGMSPEEEIETLERLIEQNKIVLNRMQERLRDLRVRTDGRQPPLPFSDSPLGAVGDRVRVPLSEMLAQQ